MAKNTMNQLEFEDEIDKVQWALVQLSWDVSKLINRTLTSEQERAVEEVKTILNDARLSMSKYKYN